MKCPSMCKNIYCSSVVTMLSLRAVTLLTLWFSLVSLMPADKHLLIETEDESGKGKPDQNKWGGGINWWPSPFESSLEAQDGQSRSNKKGMTDISQKVNVKKSTRWTWYK